MTEFRRQPAGVGKAGTRAMTKRIILLALCSLLLARCSAANAQQPKSGFRLGFLSRDIQPADSRGPVRHRLEAFQEGMRKLGYAEGKNLVIEYRYADGRLER